MKLSVLKHTLPVSVLALVVGCSDATPPLTPTDPAKTTASPSALETILADIDTGHDLPAARARLEALLAGSLAKEERARAQVALARVLESEDRERAIGLLEEASAGGDADAEKKLFSLLAGVERPSPWTRRAMDDAPVAPAARAFAKFYPEATPERSVEIDIVSFGGVDAKDGADPFAIASALRERAVQVCGLCDEVKTNIHTSSSRELFWSAVPRYAQRLERALVVFNVDRDTIVPERYAKWLAAPIADVRAAIERGDGLVAVKERSGAPPLVTIAAPRPALLRKVEASLAQMSELPTKPVTIKLRSALEPGEIQSAVRARFGAFKACYEALLVSRPSAAGTVEFSFAIGGAGGVADLVVTPGGTLADPTLQACMETAVRSMKLPVWSNDPKAKTTVKYPVVFKP